MKYREIKAWVDDGDHANYMYPGAGVLPAIYVSVDDSVMAENYKTLFVEKWLGALADIPGDLDDRLDLEARLDLEDQIWAKVESLEAELLEAELAVAARLGKDSEVG